MLITINQSELKKFPRDNYDMTDIDNPILISEAPFRFKIYAQNINKDQMDNPMLFGVVTGDLNALATSGLIYTEVSEVPTGFEQRIAPKGYSKYMTLREIKKYFRQQDLDSLIVTINGGIRLNADELSQSKLMGAVLSMNDVETQMWVDADNNIRYLTKAQFSEAMSATRTAMNDLWIKWA